MKPNTSVFLFCSGCVILFVCFVFIAFHHSKDAMSTKCNLEDSLTIPTWSDEVSTSLQPCHSFGKKLWLHHGPEENHPNCFEAGTQGPCGESMTFYRDPRKTFETVGFCDCDDVVEVKSDIPECEVIQRPLIYYPHNKRCYPVFSQGPCLYGMWLVLDENRNPTCTTNMCLGMPKTSHDDDASEGDYSLSFWFSKNEVCYRTLTKGYCDAGFILKVVKNNWRPECQRDIDADCIMTEEVNIPSLQCRPGNRLDSLKMCEIISNNDTNDATK